MDEQERALKAERKAKEDQLELLEDFSELVTITSYVEPTKLFKVFKNILSDLENQLDEMGLWSFKKTFGSFVTLTADIVRKITVDMDDDDEKYVSFWKQFSVTIDKIHNELVKKLLPDDVPDEADHILKYSSQKVRALVEYLKEMPTKLDGDKAKSFHGILFVQRKSTANSLNELLTSLKLPFIKPDFIHGDKMFGISLNNMNSMKQVDFSSLSKIFYSFY